MMGATGLRTHIWNNNLRSVLLLAGFPVLLIAIGYAMAFAFGSRVEYAVDGSFDVWGMLPRIAMYSLGIAGVWFIIAWFFHQNIINASTGARPVTREAEGELYNLLENLCVSRGMTMPRLAIIESEALNAYASGLTEKQYTVTVTRGLMRTLNRDELEAVLAHELSHIRHRDVRLMVIAVIFAGIISFAAELIFRRMIWGSIRGSRGRNAGIAMLIAMAIAAVAYLLAIVIRLSLSRKREYMADAGAVELTRNPDAMISALEKISGRAAVESAPDEMREMFIENPRTGFMGLFATHPPIEKRIEALVEHAGGNRPERPTSVPKV